MCDTSRSSPEGYVYDFVVRDWVGGWGWSLCPCGRERDKIDLHEAEASVH
jgi:hypothetical protein